MMKCRPTAYIAAASLLLLVIASYADGTSAADTDTIQQSWSHGPVSVSITATPATVHYGRDLLLDITIACPSEIDVLFPTIRDRIDGFIFNGEYALEPSASEGNTVHQQQAMLTPMIADEYRLAPMAIIYIDRSRHPATTNWFATTPIVFTATHPLNNKKPGGIQSQLKPVWVYPPFRTVVSWIGMAAGAVLIAIVLWHLAKRIKHRIKLARMSPRERALYELDELLHKELPQNNMIKQFYLELTMIVRRYIERRHTIRAPEQTTEEFLRAVTSDPRFTEVAITTLKTFLEAADLVKFAAYTPDDTAIDNATGTARDYIETDDTTEDNAPTPETKQP
jgi:hypothetical protein